ncbi:MAG: hypothetical protein AAF203_10660 [Pseudomonadota bacterium]
MNAEETQKIANLLKALGEFNRLSMIYKLCQCKTPQNAMCLCDCCQVDTSVASRHLKVLTQEDIITCERRGRERAYSLNREKLAKSLRSLADKIEGK